MGSTVYGQSHVEYLNTGHRTTILPAFDVLLITAIYTITEHINDINNDANDRWCSSLTCNSHALSSCLGAMQPRAVLGNAILKATMRPWYTRKGMSEFVLYVQWMPTERKKIALVRNNTMIKIHFEYLKKIFEKNKHRQNWYSPPLVSKLITIYRWIYSLFEERWVFFCQNPPFGTIDFKMQFVGSIRLTNIVLMFYIRVIVLAMMKNGISMYSTL